MQYINTFPHETKCDCGQTILHASHLRGLVVRCTQCNREHGPFELELSKVMAGQALRQDEANILTREPGTAVLARLEHIAQIKKPWTHDELIITFSVLNEIISRQLLQKDHPPSEASITYSLPCDEYQLVCSLLELMERLELAPKATREWPIYGEVGAKIEELATSAVSFDATASKAAFSTSLIMRPTLFKVKWLKHIGDRVYADIDFVTKVLRSLADNSQLPEDTRQAARELITSNQVKQTNRELSVRATSESHGNMSPASQPRITPAVSLLWILTAVLYGIPIGIVSGCGATNTANYLSGYPSKMAEWQPLSWTDGLWYIIGMSLMLSFTAFLVQQWLFAPMRWTSSQELAEANLKLRTHLLNALLTVPGAVLSLSFIFLAQQIVHAMKGSLNEKSGGALGAGAGLAGFLIWFGLARWWVLRKRDSAP